MPENKVTFPIIRDIIEGGQHLTKSIYENDIVKCYFCGYPICIDHRHVHLADDGMQMVDCPKCDRHVSILYYFDKVENHKHDPVRVAFHRGHRSKRG